MKTMRKEARALLLWCLAQRKPFTRQDAARAMCRDVASIRTAFERLEMLGHLEHETDYTNHYSYMVTNRAQAIEAANQEPKRAAWLEAQRRARIKRAEAARRPMINSVWSLGL